MFIYQKIGKRIFDLVVSLVALLILSPLFVILYFLIRVKLGSPCIFKQERPGYLGKLFTLYKFRTMKNGFDASGQLLPDEDRLTPFGTFLRKMSLDELPELINVIKGEMSLIGPRPLLKEYLPLYNATQHRRHSVKPGITGWAQVCGRNSLDWEKKFELDVWYTENYSFLLDFKIMMLTLYVTVKQENISHEGHITMPKFVNEHQHDMIK